MERKFKHKKTGEIISYKDGVMKSGSFVFELGCEPSKEYWEEIKEEVNKDWKILELITNSYFGITSCQIDINAFLDKVPCTKNWEIKKVKRLSDGEVFTIGDKYKNDIIKSFKLFDNDERLYVISENKTWGLNINQLSKEKSVLFTTEDGVSIREGDNYWFIWVKGKHLPDYQTLYHPYFVKNAAKLDLDEYWSKDARFFSTEKAAKDFIIYHKPCLSIKEILSVEQRIIVDEEKLKQLVKTKIDL